MIDLSITQLLAILLATALLAWFLGAVTGHALGTKQNSEIAGATANLRGVLKELHEEESAVITVLVSKVKAGEEIHPSFDPPPDEWEPS